MEMVLKWCKEHEDLVWFYDNGTWSCMWLVKNPIDNTQCKIVDQTPKEYQA